MIRFLLSILFLFKLKLTRGNNVTTYLRRKYDGLTLRNYRRLESSMKKLRKAQLDHDFLLYCKMGSIIPNFVKFRLYRSSLYSTEFYKNTTESLLEMEIEFKSKNVNRLNTVVSSNSTALYDTISLIDGLYIKNLLKKNIEKFAENTSLVHKRKLLKLGLQQPNFLSPKDVIFNFSDYKLSKKEEFLLALGLDFCLPNYKPNYARFFLSFELLFNNIRSLPSHSNIEQARKTIQDIAHRTYSSIKRTTWFPFFKLSDFKILKNLSQVKDLVICRPDKGKGVVLLNRSDYVNKMENILSDNTKFIKLESPQFSTIFRTEDKINRTLKQFKDDSLIDEHTYQNLFSSGSSFSILYGSPKVHKDDVPLRPILAAYNAPNFQIAKYLVPLLSHLSINQYTLSNSSKFVPDILQQDANQCMVSFDVQSLFTSIPLLETIELILAKLFPDSNSSFHGFNRNNFKKLLDLAVLDTHFLFNGTVYKQVDGLAMGSPLGPTFANIFMCCLEELFLEQCPESFKPTFYRRYVDDTFLLFENQEHATCFLDYVNTFHQNIKFTMESETNNKISFLDILISRSEGKFRTGIFRKNTFTGLGLNFYSFCPVNFKLNSCNTLLFRAYSLCSDWLSFHSEIGFLRNYFYKNCYPHFIFDKIVYKFLSNIFKPKSDILTVPRKLMYVSLPYTSNSSSVKSQLTKSLTKLYPYVEFRFIFKNPFTLGSLFRFKDSLPELMRAFCIYLYTCPKCNLGNYIGCSRRLLKVRIDSHRGVSYRTGSSLTKKEFSAIRSHAEKCKCQIQYEDFKIITQAPNQYTLPFLESLYIKQMSPHLNSQTTSISLHIA